LKNILQDSRPDRSKNQQRILRLTLSAMLLALFFIAGNIIPPVMLLPEIPFTLQTFVIGLMALFLGCKGGAMCLTALFLLTAAGVPMMSGFRGGVGVFLSPTAGFILGFAFIIVTLGLYADVIRDRLASQWLRTAVFLLLSAVGIVLLYGAGAFILAVQTGAMGSFFTLLTANFIFFPLDMVKLCGALAVYTFMRRFL